MFMIDPHLWHAIAYLVLLILVVRIGFRVLMSTQFGGLSLGDDVLMRARGRVSDLLSLEAVRISPAEVGFMLAAHVLLAASSVALFLHHPG